MKLAIGSDHAGFKLKEYIIRYLKRKQIPFKDFGTYSEDSCDYPDFAYPVAKAVSQKKCARGILICGSGIGMAMTANKVKGIRAAQVYDLYTARMSREHNDANIITFAAREISGPKAIKLLSVWLKTPFAGGRHLRRVRKIG